MTLKEKMLNVRDPYEKYPMCFDTANECTLIAEDFAIGFADWIPYNAYKESSCWRMYDKKDNEYTIQELINEYKKQVEL